ncbi:MULTISPECIES: hypothetical protein [Vibrio]|uniref:hypothetical protein n=1 Tax=Vibrio TaxID=662 RepID=UPI000C83D754|nr:MULTISPECIES: hypothetical protein [Vibrio]MCQ8866358.1 hypothetical protein [Vibrio splendidus]PMK99891.1 hypothetical protein BCT90_02995 [Vibrio lentus]
MSIYSYIYTHKKNFLKNPNDSHSIGNFRGQVYEASFYEWLKDNVECLNMKLVAKHPYTTKTNTKDGFYSTKEGSCCYFSRGVRLFEFDALCFSTNSIVFYECFLSKWDHVKKSHRTDCKRKITFLRNLFPSHAIKCVVVSDKEENLDVFCEGDGFEAHIYAEPKVDLNAIAKENKPQKLSQTFSMIDPNLVNQVAQKFDFLSLQLKLAKSFNKTKDIQDITKQVISYGEVIKRIYIGAIDAKLLNVKLDCKETDHVILSLDFSKIVKPTLRYYIYRKDVSELIHNKKAKVLNHYQGSRKELLLCKEHIKLISKDDYMEICLMLAPREAVTLNAS